MSFVEKYQPVYGPETELGADTDVDNAAPPDIGGGSDEGSDTPERQEGPGSGRSELRRSLEDGFEQARKRAERDDAPDAPKRTRKSSRGDRVGNRAEAMPQEGAQGQPQQSEDDVVLESSPPEGWSPEAKAAWANSEIPDEIRAAVLKREYDINRGVRSIIDRYSEIDQALAPHAQAIQAYGKTPAQAVNQLFAWFNALGQNPMVAFPALARSFGYDIAQFVYNPPQQRQQQAVPQQPTQNPAQAPANAQAAANGKQLPVDKAYADWVNQQFGKSYQAYQGLAQNLQAVQQENMQMRQVVQQQLQAQAARQQAETEGHLAQWAQDKPFYEQVREPMARLLASGTFGLTQDGRVDLDALYDAAVHALPEVRNQVYQQQAAEARARAKAQRDAERRAQAQQAQQALRAATSVPLSAPGVPPLPNTPRTRGKSVGDSLREAVLQVRGE